jgi:hypothetical protein
MFCPAKSVRFFQYRMKNWGNVTGRAVDDAQHFGGRGLLFESLTRLGDQPCIFNRDNRLGGEVL